jgi:hypothetical protein
MMGEVEVESKKEGRRAISRQNPKLVINFGQKCPKTYPKLTEVQSPEVLMPGNFLSLSLGLIIATIGLKFQILFELSTQQLSELHGLDLGSSHCSKPYYVIYGTFYFAS